MATQQQSEGQGAGFEASDLQGLLNKEFKPRSDAAKEAVETAVRTLAEQALGASTVISSDTIGTIEAMIAALDRKLSEQVNLIMHHKAFQEVESAWRGLNYLVTNTETDEMLKIRVLNISKADLGRTLKRFKGVAWDQSPLFKKLYEAEYGQFGGEPFGCLVGDYYFDHTPPDVEMVGQMAQVAAAAHCPFIAGVSPSVMQMESWQELANLGELGVRDGREHHAVVQALWLVLAHPRCGVGRVAGGPAGSHVPDRRRRCGHEVPDRDRHQRSAGGRAGQERLHAIAPSQEHGHRGVHRCAVAAETVRVHRSGRHRQCQSLGPAAVPLRGLPVRALSEVHRARQDRLLQGAQRDGGVAQQVDLAVRPEQSGVGR